MFTRLRTSLQSLFPCLSRNLWTHFISRTLVTRKDGCFTSNWKGNKIRDDPRIWKSGLILAPYRLVCDNSQIVYIIGEGGNKRFVFSSSRSTLLTNWRQWNLIWGMNAAIYTAFKIFQCLLNPILDISHRQPHQWKWNKRYFSCINLEKEIV